MAARPSLTTAGNANSTRRDTDANAVAASDPSGVLTEFRDHVAQSVMSSNVHADKIRAFDETETVLHGRAYRIHCAGGNEVQGLAEFISESWAKRREAFEDLWHEGRTAIYGAVNSGNMGVEGDYGPFCLVLDDPTPLASGLAAFPGDTAQAYTNASAEVDEAAAHAAVTAWGDRRHLGLIEREDAALAHPRDKWPEVVCNPSSYLETVRTGELPLQGVAAVRIRRSFKEAADDFTALQAVLPDAEKQAERENDPVLAGQADAVQTLNRWRRTLSIDLQVLDDGD